MLDFLNTLKDTPIPTILVVAGIVFILLAIAGQFEILRTPPLTSPWQKWVAGIVGGLFLIAGLLIYLRPNLAGGGWIGPLVAVMAILILIVLFVVLRLVARLLTSEDRAYNDKYEEMKSSLAREESSWTPPDKRRGSVLIRVDKEMKGHEVTIIGRKGIPHQRPIEQRGETYFASWQNVLCDTYTVEIIDLDPKKSEKKPVRPWQVAEFDLRLRKSGWIARIAQKLT
jgi:hypothetical protein